MNTNTLPAIPRDNATAGCNCSDCRCVECRCGMASVCGCPRKPAA